MNKYLVKITRYWEREVEADNEEAVRQSYRRVRL